MSEMTTNHVLKLVKKGKRLSPRKFEEYRDISVETGFTRSAEGSARVKIGDTEVMAGIKFELNEPYPDKPDSGSIMVNAELTPMSSSEYEPGPPQIKAIELARVIDRGIRESGAIDFKKLCIEKGEKVWNILIDLVTVNDCGNLFDAFSLAALAALNDAKYPEIKDGQVDYKHLSDKGVELEGMPVSCTVVKIAGKLLIDPELNEEDAISSRLTVATLNDDTVCALQKGGDEPLDSEEIMNMIDLGIEKCKELRNKI